MTARMSCRALHLLGSQVPFLLILVFRLFSRRWRLIHLNELRREHGDFFPVSSSPDFSMLWYCAPWGGAFAVEG